MTEMNIRLDMDGLRSVVQAKVRPAVEAALAEIDMQAIIRRQLAAPPAKEAAPSGRMGAFLVYAGQDPVAPASLIERLVQDAVRDMAKDYVQRQMRDQRPFLEDAFARMMAQSHNRLVRAFADAAVRGLEDDWSFDLDVKVTHKGKEDGE